MEEKQRRIMLFESWLRAETELARKAYKNTDPGASYDTAAMLRHRKDMLEAITNAYLFFMMSDQV